jgi:hypothetical protein
MGEGGGEVKIAIDIGNGKSCWNCKHLIRNLPVTGFRFGIPVVPTCFVFGKQIGVEREKEKRLPECIAAEIIDIKPETEEAMKETEK